MDDFRPIAFMHVPKSAGSTVVKALQSAFADRSHLRGFDRVLFGRSYDMATMTPAGRAAIFDADSEKLRSSEVVAGHFAFSTLIQALPTARYVTIVREPISRLMSLRVYWRSVKDEEPRARGELQVRRITTSQRPLAEFLSARHVALQTDNILVRMLLWPDELIQDDEFIEASQDQAILDKAIERLSRFDFVDFIENSLWQENLSLFIGRSLTVKDGNYSRPMPHGRECRLESELDRRAWALLKMRTRLDEAVWRHVVRQRGAEAEADFIRQEAIGRAIARHSVLLRGISERATAER